VRRQLDRLLHSAQFAEAPRLRRFLVHVVEQTLAGQTDRLKGYTLGLAVFDRPSDFDPQTDTIVRVQAGQLRRRLDQYYATTGRDDPLRIALPRGGYTPTFTARPDLTPPPPAPTATATERAEPRVAVLPFVNASGDPADQAFADGLTVETLADLCRFRHMAVLSRLSTAGLRGDSATVTRLHDALGVDYVLEAMVRKSPDAVRVTASLTDAASGAVLFSEQIHRPVDPAGLFSLQDEIALRVAGRIADRYGPLGRHLLRSQRPGRSRRWDTCTWITRFYAYRDSHAAALHHEIRAGLTQALAADAEASDGWAALSTLRLDEYRFHIDADPAGDDPRLAALSHARRAVASDPENAFAHQALAMAHYFRREFDEFRLAAGRAVDLNPGHADVLADIGLCHCLRGDWDLGLPLVERAVTLSPVHPGWYRYPRAWQRSLAGDPAGALHEIRRSPTPDFIWYHAMQAWFQAERGDTAGAADSLARVQAAVPDFATRVPVEVTRWCVEPALAARAQAAWTRAGLTITAPAAPAARPHPAPRADASAPCAPRAAASAARPAAAAGTAPPPSDSAR
jgi:TolB-like protein